ncbi:MAG: 3-phosphoserine/phosphohydroxythreonine transaminase, partial [Myxococcota bacterium]
MSRVHNFYPGPAVLPLSVLEEAQRGLLDYQGMGAGIMEISHRSEQFEVILKRAQQRIRRLFNLPGDTHVLFFQGGARLQFAMVPMNFLHKKAAYINTGNWSKGAIAEASKMGAVSCLASSAEQGFDRIPHFESSMLNGDEDYLHITTNNTIYGTQWHHTPPTEGVPLIADMCSDIASRPFDFSPYDMVYAGAQKNLGPAGVTVVLLKDTFVQKAKQGLPAMLSYQTFID